MRPRITTRRNIIKGAGTAGLVGLVGGSATAAKDGYDGYAQESDHSDGDDDDARFAAVRVGNLVPDLAVTESRGGPPSDTPGAGPPGTPSGPDRPSRPAETALDLYVGKPPDRNPTIGDVSYPTFGPGAGDAYLQVPAREYDIAVARSGSVEPLLDERVDVAAGHRYTALAIGTATSEGGPALQPLIVEDATDREQATPPEADEEITEVSFVHASPNAGPVDIDVDGFGSVLTDVEFGDVSGYLGVPSREYTIDVQSGGETVLSLTRELVPATRLTVYVTGFAGVDEFPDEDGRFGLSAVATIDGLNPQPRTVLTR